MWKDWASVKPQRSQNVKVDTFICGVRNRYPGTVRLWDQWRKATGKLEPRRKSKAELQRVAENSNIKSDLIFEHNRTRD